MKVKELLALSGSPGSGKTAVAKALSSRIGWPVASFGRYVAELARRKGLKADSIAVLQDVGQTAVVADVEAFVENFLSFSESSSGERLILDGLRHIEVYRELVSQTHASWSGMVFLDVREDVRLERLRRRDLEVTNQRDHPVESQIALLRSRADIVVDTTSASSEEIAATLDTWLRESGASVS